MKAFESAFNVAGGKAYSFREIAGWCAAAGLEQIRRSNLLTAPGAGIIIAQKPRW